MVTGGGWKKQLGSELKPLINDRINDRKHLEAGEGGEGRQVAGMASPSSAQREPRAGGATRTPVARLPLCSAFVGGERSRLAVRGVWSAILRDQPSVS